MSSLQEQLSVAPAGQGWQIGEFKLWQSTQEDIILFIRQRPQLSIRSDGRYQAALTVLRQWQQGKDTITGGIITFATTLAHPYNAAFEQLQQHWRQELTKRGYTNAERVKFLPLPVQSLKTDLKIDSTLGQLEHSNDLDSATTIDSTQYFSIKLSDRGTQQYLDGIQLRRPVSGILDISYEYPQTLPAMTVRVKVHGKKIFETVKINLNKNRDQTYYGNVEEVDHLWQKLLEEDSIEIILPNNLTPDLGMEPQRLITTFTNQVKQHLIDQLFTTQPDPFARENAVLYLFKWRKQSEAIEVSLELSVNGWTWLKAQTSVELTTLLGTIDISYAKTVYQEVALPILVTVKGHPLIRTVALSLSASEGMSPQALTFGSDGGSRDFLITTRNPNSITLQYQAQITFTSAKWSLVEISKTVTIAEGGQRILLQPGQWIRQVMIHLMAREGNQTKAINDLPKGEYLVANCTYQAPHLTRPIKESARLAPREPLQFTYLQDPQGRFGQLKCSVMGFLNGQMIRTAETIIQDGETNVFVLIDRNGVQLISRNTATPEDDEFAQTLLQAQSRPLIMNGV